MYVINIICFSKILSVANSQVESGVGCGVCYLLFFFRMKCQVGLVIDKFFENLFIPHISKTVKNLLVFGAESDIFLDGFEYLF